MHRVQGRLSTYHLIIKMSTDDHTEHGILLLSFKWAAHGFPFLFRPMIFRSGIRYQPYRKKDRDKNRSF